MRVRDRKFYMYPKGRDPFANKLACMVGHYPVLERELVDLPKGFLATFDAVLGKYRGYSWFRIKKGNFTVQDAIIIQKEFFPRIPIATLFRREDTS